MAPLGCMLFDLDGTLLDTAPDMTRVLNRLRREAGLEELPAHQVRPYVSHGTVGLLKVGFDLTPSDVKFEPLRRRFLDLYSTDLVVDTALFPTMDRVLHALEDAGLPWGVVTNKPGWLTDPLLEALGLRARCACVVSGDTLPQRKPDPAPLLHASRQAETAPDRCLYVGDAQRDIEAGQRAGMRTVVARYGYLHPDETPQAWGADAIVDAPQDLLAWLADGGP